MEIITRTTEDRCHRLTWDDLVEALLDKVNEKRKSVYEINDPLEVEDVRIVFRDNQGNSLFDPDCLACVDLVTSTECVTGENTPSEEGPYP